jgi:tRNA pseudouridine55 synthase
MVDGLVVVDKPAGWTSHDVVARCRRVFGQRKVGHAGTLDPDATGVLLVGLGRATRLLQFLVGLPKSYTGEVVLGVATTTLDAGGEVTGRWDMSGVTVAEARSAAGALTGTLAQIPPMVSAIQVGGRRLHDLARAGVEVERQARTVTVSRFDVTAAGPGVLAIEVDCSSGTYVRSLAADLGTALGGGAHLRNLRRTAVGRWTVAEATPLDSLSLSQVLTPAAALADLAAVMVPADLVGAVGHGKVLTSTELAVDGDGPWAVLDPCGDLLAVYQPHGDGRLKPIVVLSADPGPSAAGPSPGPSAAEPDPSAGPSAGGPSAADPGRTLPAEPGPSAADPRAADPGAS